MQPAPSNVVEAYSKGVSDFMMSMEELNRSTCATDISLDTLVRWRCESETSLGILDFLRRHVQDGLVGDAEKELFEHCRQKLMSTLSTIVHSAVEYIEPDIVSDESQLEGFENDDVSSKLKRMEAQQCIARIFELSLVLSTTDQTVVPKSSDEVIQLYSDFQRQTLRMRCRPVIAELVQTRKSDQVKLTRPESAATRPVPVEEDDESVQSSFKQLHAPICALILGECVELCRPLIAWRDSLPLKQDAETPIITCIRRLCEESVMTVDEQAQSLVKTIMEWYSEDRPVDSWMKKSADLSELGILNHYELSILAFLVDEISLACRVQARYKAFLIEESRTSLTESPISKEILPELTWKYATLERYLVLQQWQSAVTSATPVQIVMGTKVMVPSIVEDAQVLSTRALERAESTESLHAIGTVAHALTNDVWSPDMETGLRQALSEKRGCWAIPEEVHNDSGVEEKGDFAAALLDALDEDLGADAKEIATNNPPMPAPHSGGFLGALVGGNRDEQRKMELEAIFCMLNGMNAAASGCRSLLSHLNGLLEETSETEHETLEPTEPVLTRQKSYAMINLANEELSSYTLQYEQHLAIALGDVTDSWCGSANATNNGEQQTAADFIRGFLSSENYNIDDVEYASAASDERLQKELYQPLLQSTFLSSLSTLCDSRVLELFADLLSSRLSETVISVLWAAKPRVSEFGSLLIAKEARLLQDLLVEILSSDGQAFPSLIEAWERLSQVLEVLQIEKPSDWSMYHSSCVLAADEVEKTMSLRVGFSAEAVGAAVASYKKDKVNVATTTNE